MPRRKARGDKKSGIIQIVADRWIKSCATLIFFFFCALVTVARLSCYFATVKATTNLIVNILAEGILHASRLLASFLPVLFVALQLLVT